MRKIRCAIVNLVALSAIMLLGYLTDSFMLFNFEVFGIEGDTPPNK